MLFEDEDEDEADDEDDDANVVYRMQPPAMQRTTPRDDRNMQR